MSVDYFNKYTFIHIDNRIITNTILSMRCDMNLLCKRYERPIYKDYSKREVHLLDILVHHLIHKLHELSKYTTGIVFDMLSLLEFIHSVKIIDNIFTLRNYKQKSKIALDLWILTMPIDSLTTLHKRILRSLSSVKEC